MQAVSTAQTISPGLLIFGMELRPYQYTAIPLPIDGSSPQLCISNHWNFWQVVSAQTNSPSHLIFGMELQTYVKFI